jgi:hypothetical protein
VADTNHHDSLTTLYALCDVSQPCAASAVSAASLLVVPSARPALIRFVRCCALSYLLLIFLVDRGHNNAYGVPQAGRRRREDRRIIVVRFDKLPVPALLVEVLFPSAGNPTASSRIV